MFGTEEDEEGKTTPAVGYVARCYGSHLVPDFNSDHLSTELSLGEDRSSTSDGDNPKTFALQRTLVAQILLSIHFDEYPPPVPFQRSFWKAVITWIESADEVVCDNIYDRYIALLQTSSVTLAGPPSPAYLTQFYRLPQLAVPPTEPDNPTYSSITLLESRTTIEAGTTGLRTWRASYALGEWLISNTDIAMSPNILELGSGAGFLGILVAQLQMRAHNSTGRRLWLTDVHSAVIERCRHNVALENNKLQHHHGVTVHALDWTDCMPTSPQFTLASDFMKIAAPDLILGADLVYDDSIIPALVATISLALGENANSKALVATSVRRPSTFDTFKNEAESAGLLVAVVPYSHGSSFLLADDDRSRGEGSNEVVILRVTRQHA